MYVLLQEDAFNILNLSHVTGGLTMQVQVFDSI